MISITRPNIPDVLQANQQNWTNELLMLVHQFGSYTDIPEPQKNAVLKYYKQEEIKLAVRDIHHGKCIYCEAYIENIDYPHIEHFYPKSLYPKYTFKWSNLFPSCTKCNIPKGDLDTKATKIVNPEKEDPEQFFGFKELRIEPSVTSPDSVKSENTILHCDLQRISLSRDYATLLCGLYETENNLKTAIAHYGTLHQNAAKLKKANEIREAIDNLKEQCNPEASYAGYMRYLLRSSTTIGSSIAIINQHSAEMGIGNYAL